MKSRFVSSAEEEFADAGSFYESERLGLGDEFFETIRAAVNLLEEIPEMGSPIDSSFRSVVIRRFPYRIIYKIAGSEIVIIAVAHQSRHRNTGAIACDCTGSIFDRHGRATIIHQQQRGMRAIHILASIFLLAMSVIAADAQTNSTECSDPKDVKIKALVQQALKFEEGENLRAAIGSNKKILEIQPRNECALTTIAGLYGKMQDFEEEVVWARKAIQANPKFANAYLNLGNGQASLGDIKAALASFTKAREMEPKNPLPLYSLGVLAEQQEKFPEAIELYAKSVEIDPKFEDGYFNLAAAYANMKRFAEAKTALKKLLELNPNAQDAKDMLRQLEREKP